MPARRHDRSRGPEGLLSLLHQRRSEIEELARRHGVTNVRVFGSVARGEDTAGSDVDLLVDFPPDITLFSASAFRRELAELLGVDVDVVSARALLPRDADILEDAVAL